MTSDQGSRCPLCGGVKAPGMTTYTVDLGSGVIVIRDVPAMVCERCGEEWIGADTARTLEGLVEAARRSKRQVEVVAFEAAVTAA
ncbi:MAG: type II toxin-antitoxin system MqsA family antitoxin [Armatimonadetes bacterium]|nr:type II toxin-antitoxin system MqsA family antitoxin [Armatimonadota bacterium]